VTSTTSNSVESQVIVSSKTAASKRDRLGKLVRDFALIPVIVLIVIVGGVINTSFLTSANLTNIALQSASLGVVVVAESIILLSGGIDLSLQSTYGLAPMVGAWLIAPAAGHGLGIGLNPTLGLVITIAVGAAVGLFNGLMITKARVNGFILTLAMLILLAGLQTGIVSGETLYSLGDEFTALGTQAILGVPVSVIVTIVVFVFAGLYMRYTRGGRSIYAIGGNQEAARAAGIKVDGVRVGVYVVGGALAALGGIMAAGRVEAVAANQGANLIFTVFAAAVIGGVSLNGGKGNIIGAATGVILLALVVNLLTLEQVQSYWIDAVNGLVILIALTVSRLVGGESAD
jgi:simple sugar transport system permease protein